jgi:hypothetical protein
MELEYMPLAENIQSCAFPFLYTDIPYNSCNFLCAKDKVGLLMDIIIFVHLINPAWSKMGSQNINNVLRAIYIENRGVQT